MKIILPWPDARLSPNARLHWRAKVGPKQSARIKTGWIVVTTEGFHATRERFLANEEPIPITVSFFPPDSRRRDDDNMVGSFKSYRDGIAQAFGIDDRRFRPRYVFCDPEKPGRVEVIFLSTESTFNPPLALVSATSVPSIEGCPSTEAA